MNWWQRRGKLAKVGIVVGGLVIVASSTVDAPEPSTASTKPREKAEPTLEQCIKRRGLPDVERAAPDLIRAWSNRGDLVRFQVYPTRSAASNAAAELDRNVISYRVEGRVVALWPTEPRSVGIDGALDECLGKPVDEA